MKLRDALDKIIAREKKMKKEAAIVGYIRQRNTKRNEKSTEEEEQIMAGKYRHVQTVMSVEDIGALRKITGKSVKESVAEAIEYFMSHHNTGAVVQERAANPHPETSR